ncbi:MAG: hypothetical protein IJ335_09145 [Lachnospiraceae bacterium]|nr:hypothetical protein [Lachnospiraceae bacterium]
MKNKKKWMALLVMMLLASMSLCACRKDDVSAETTSGYEVAESSGKESLESASNEVTESSKEDNEESSVVEETDKTTETIESTETRETEESAEETKESVAPSKEQESSKPSKAPESTQQTTVKEETKPSQEAPKPSVSTPTVEQPKPSTPQVHTCDYGSGTVTKEATCKEEGVRTFTCSCGASKTESIGKTGHNYVTDSKAATCTEAGYEKTACSSCGDVKSESTTPATGHSMEEHWFPSGPTCVTDGGMHFEKCTKCGVTNDLPPGQPLGHNPDAGTVIREENCVRGSLIEHYCTRCPQKLDYTEGPKDPNKHLEWVFDEDEQVWYCPGCGTTK